MTFEVIDNSRIDQSTPGMLTVVNAVRINGVNYDVEIVDDAPPSLQDDPFLANRVKGLWNQLSQTIPTHHLELLQIHYTGAETTIQFQSLQGRVEHLNGQGVRFDLEKFKQDACVGDSFGQRFAPARYLTAHGAVSYIFESALKRHFVSLPGASSNGFGDSSQPQLDHPHSSTQVDLSSPPSSRRSSVSVSPTRSPQPRSFTSSPISSPQATSRRVASGGTTVELDDSDASKLAVNSRHSAPVAPRSGDVDASSPSPRLSSFTFSPVPGPNAYSRRVANGRATVELIDDSVTNPAVSPGHSAPVAPRSGDVDARGPSPRHRHFSFPPVSSPQATSTRVANDSAVSSPTVSPRHSASVAPWPIDVDARGPSPRPQRSLGARFEDITESSLPAASRSSDKAVATARPLVGSSAPLAAVSERVPTTIAEAFRDIVALQCKMACLEKARAERERAARTK